MFLIFQADVEHITFSGEVTIPKLLLEALICFAQVETLYFYCVMF